MILRIWTKEVIPEDWRKVIIDVLSFHRDKGDMRNHEITILTYSSGGVFSRIVLGRMKNLLLNNETGAKWFHPMQIQSSIILSVLAQRSRIALDCKPLR